MIISNNQKMNRIIKEYVFDKNNLNLIEKMKNLHVENVIKNFKLFVYLYIQISSPIDSLILKSKKERTQISFKDTFLMTN